MHGDILLLLRLSIFINCACVILRHIFNVTVRGGDKTFCKSDNKKYLFIKWNEITYINKCWCINSFAFRDFYEKICDRQHNCLRIF